jgi:glutamyl-tRNA reductase
MVVGEAQILGQIKSAYQMAVEHETVGPYLHKACHAAFRVAKRVRSETEVADGPVSVGTLAVDIITKEIGDLRNANVLLIGAGEMGNLVALHLKERGAGHIWISNRTAVAAEMLAKEVGGTVVPFESWPSHLHTADVVVASIGGGTLITGKHVEDVLKIGSRKKMVMMDLGLPRNIEPAVKNLGVRLFNIDDLDEIAKENLRIRKRAALKAEDIVQSECGTTFDELRTIKLAPVLENLRKKCSFVADEELLRLFKENPGLTLDEQASIRRCVSAIVKKLIHEPVRAAKQEMILGEPSDGGALQVLNKLVM